MRADSPEAAPEGWRVPQRRAMIAAALVPMVLLLALVLAGRLYDRDLRPRQRQPVTAFPAPGLETAVHDGAIDPSRRGRRAGGDRAIQAAKRRVAAEGWR